MPNLNRVLFGLGAVFGIAALVGVLIFVGDRAVNKYGHERYQAGQADAYAAVERKAHALELKANALAAKLRERNDADNRHITADAADLRVRGPGKAICTSVNPTPAAASGHVAGRGSTDPAVDKVPDTERLGFIALPFSATIAAAEQCDANRAELISWRTQREGTK